MGMRESMSYYMSAHMLVVGANILFGLALIFSVAGKRYWLKLTAIFSILIGVALMAVALWYINSTSDQKLLTLEQIYKWASLIACIGPILMTMNFLSEQKELRPEDHSTPSQTMEGLMAATRVIALLATLFFGLKLTTETLTKLSWERDLERKKEKEWETVWGARTFAGSDGDTLKYQLIKPLDFDPNKKYPMVVCLPYGGGSKVRRVEIVINSNKQEKIPFVSFCSLLF